MRLCAALLLLCACAGEDDLRIELHSRLARAAWRGDRDTVRLMLRAGVSPSGRTAGVLPALMAAVDHGDQVLAAELLAAGADPNPNLKWRRQPLCLAYQKGDAAMAKLLLAHGAKCVPGMDE